MIKERSLEKKYIRDKSLEIKAAFLLCQSGFKGSIENDEIKELKTGIKRIKSHVLGGKYSILQAKRDASKIAVLASIIKDGQLDINLEEVKKK